MEHTGDHAEDTFYEVLYVKVEKLRAERIRKKLIASDLLHFRAPVLADGDSVLFPVVGDVGEDSILSIIDDSLDRSNPSSSALHFSRRTVHLRESIPFSFRDIIDIPVELEKYLPSSWDVVGDIIIVKIAEEILSHKHEIARAILETHKSIRSVYRVLKVSGDRRVRELEHIGGVERTETMAKEFGVRLHLDVADVYYSPRLATERWRVAEQIGKGERILDMFAGIGPFSLVISRHTPAADIHSVDINPAAVSYMEKNIAENEAENVTAYLGDAHVVCREFKEKFDRIIMNLPHSSVDFLESALRCSKKGTVIHLYIIEERERIDEIIGECIRVGEELGYKITERKRVTVKSYSPVEVNICSDILVEKN